jgi:invasion protein IalB
VLGKASIDDPLCLVVQVPLGVWLPSGTTLYLDAETTTGLAVPFTIWAQGCLANGALAPDRLAALKAATGSDRLDFINDARSPPRELAFPALR